MLGKQSYPATRQGKIKGTGGEEGEEQSLFSPQCPWWALRADARVSGLNCGISWAISHCPAGHRPLPQHFGWRLACNKPPPWQGVGTVPSHPWMLLAPWKGTCSERLSAGHWSDPPEHQFACSSWLSKRFYL